MILGTFKQKMLLIHNKVNLAVLGQGLKRQSIELTDNKIIITAINKRLATLSVLDSIDLITSKTVEVALIMRLKEELKKELKEQLNLEPIAIFKDYDPSLETSLCVFLFSKNIYEIIDQL